MAGQYEGKVALVTAAGAGIGAATAQMFAERGARVMLADINGDAGEARAELLRPAGGDVRFLSADATEEDDIARLVAETVAAYGGLDIAANIVGDAHTDVSGNDFHNQSLESWEHTVAVTLRSVFFSMKYEIARMIEYGGGSIVNVTSLAGMPYVWPAGAAYAASKAGVVRLTKFAAVS